MIRFDAPMYAGRIVFGQTGLGMRGDSIPSTGSNGPSILYNDITLPGEAADEFRAEVLTQPGGGTIVWGEYGDFTASGFADGTYSGTYRGYKNGQSYGTASYGFTIGAGGGVTHVATGALQAAVAVVAGTANRIGAVVPVTHVATGVLAAQPATVTGGTQGRLGGFEYATGAKSTSRKPVYLRRLEQRSDAADEKPSAAKQDATEAIEKKAARMLLDKKGEQSLGPLLKQWQAEKPKVARGADPRATFLKRVRSRIAAMMEDEDSLSTFL